MGLTETLKVVLTAKENGKGKRPHQAFLLLQETETGLEAPFPLTTKDNGKATVEVVGRIHITQWYHDWFTDLFDWQKQADLPVQLLASSKPLKASLILASFGASEGYNKPVFDVEIKLDPSAGSPTYEKPLRYGKLEEIHHIFRPDPQSPPKVISLVFALAVLATVPALFIGVSTGL